MTGCVSSPSQCVESCNFCLPQIWLAVISLLWFPVCPWERQKKKQIQEAHHWTLKNRSTIPLSHHPMITLWTWPGRRDGFDRWKHFCFSCQHPLAGFFSQTFPFSHSRFCSNAANTEAAATAALFETQWAPALHAMRFCAESSESSLARQTKVYSSCVWLLWSFVSFCEWPLMYYLQSFLTFDLSLPLSLPLWLALLFFNLLCADMHWYHLLPFIKYFVLAKCSP